MLSCWRNCRHWLYRIFLYWQLPVQPVTQMLKRRHFRFSDGQVLVWHEFWLCTQNYGHLRTSAYLYSKHVHVYSVYTIVGVHRRSERLHRTGWLIVLTGDVYTTQSILKCGDKGEICRIRRVKQTHECFVLPVASQWRYNERDGVSNHQPHECLLNRKFKAQVKEETSKLRVTGLCEGNSPVTGEFPAQRASDAENVSPLVTSSWNALHFWSIPHPPLDWSSRTSVTYMRLWTGLTLVQIMACHLIGAKPLLEPKLSHC